MMHPMVKELPKNNRVMTVHIRLDAETLSRIEAHQQRMDQKMPGVGHDRLSAMRALLSLGLREAERAR
jgi:hypothetical protein